MQIFKTLYSFLYTKKDVLLLNETLYVAHQPIFSYMNAFVK